MQCGQRHVRCRLTGIGRVQEQLASEVIAGVVRDAPNGERERSARITDRDGHGHGVLRLIRVHRRAVAPRERDPFRIMRSVKLVRVRTIGRLKVGTAELAGHRAQAVNSADQIFTACTTAKQRIHRVLNTDTLRHVIGDRSSDTINVNGSKHHEAPQT